MSDAWVSPTISYRHDIDGWKWMIARADQPNRFSWLVTTYANDGTVLQSDELPERGDRVTGPVNMWRAEEACWSLSMYTSTIEIKVPGYEDPFII